MAGPLQAGDIINFGRLAWDVYQLGWSEDHNASTYFLRQISSFDYLVLTAGLQQDNTQNLAKT
jgi:hypothetical protein